MHARDLPVHLLRDAAVREMALFGRSQLDEMEQLSKIPGEQDPNAVRQREDILCLQGEVPGDVRVGVGRSFHTRVKRGLQAIGGDFGRAAETVHDREILAGLGGHAMTLNIPKGPVI